MLCKPKAKAEVPVRHMSAEWPKWPEGPLGALRSLDLKASRRIQGTRHTPLVMHTAALQLGLASTEDAVRVPEVTDWLVRKQPSRPPSSSIRLSGFVGSVASLYDLFVSALAVR